MTATDADTGGRFAGGLATVAKLALATLVTAFALGGATGAMVATAERGLSVGRGAVIAGFALAAIAGAYWLIALLRRLAATGPQAPRIATARKMVIASGAIGGIIGLAIAVATIAPGDAPAFNPLAGAPLPPWLAAALIAVLVLVVAPVTWIWHRSIDEHEAAAYRFGALVGIYAYSALSAIWWLGARGGFLPPVDGMIVFFVTFAVWGLGWAWARFR